MLGKVSSGYVRILQVKPDYASLVEIRTG